MKKIVKNKKKHGVGYYVQILTAASSLILFLLILTRLWWESEHGKPGLADIFIPDVRVINDMLAVTGIITILLVTVGILIQYKKLKKK